MCEQKYPHHRDMLSSDYRNYSKCTSSIGGLIGLGMGLTTDPVVAAATEVGSKAGEATCHDQCK